jgi:mannosyltransferase OCH1-like enzyme
MIPKKIHYCWFGGNPLPLLAQKCIESWKKYLPDYEIIEWNEANYDVHKIPYISQAYKAKKYAFVSDYARVDILNEHGGVYFDTDVEVLKDLSLILAKGPFLGIEAAGAIANGLGMAAEQGDAILKEILDSYSQEAFLNPDGTYNLKTVVVRVSDIFRQYGFTDNESQIQEVANYTIYPPEYFCPKNVQTGILTITENTYTIHHYDASWLEDWQKQVQIDKYKIYKKLGNNLISNAFVAAHHVFMALKNKGVIDGIKYCKDKLK